MNRQTPGNTPDPYSPDTTLTLSEIAALTGRDLKTIKTWNDSGKGRWPNAIQDETGRKTWRVQVRDLVASGDLDPSQVEQVENELAARRESKETKACASRSSASRRSSPLPTPSPTSARTIVKGQLELPGGGHETCPVTVTRNARWWPWDLPKGG